MLAAKALCDRPVLLLIAATLIVGISQRCLVALRLPVFEKVTMTFSSFLGFGWCFITTGYFSIRATSMA
jgi:hypothetical protein